MADRGIAGSQRRHAGAGGFSIVELVIVAAIIGVAAAVAVPRYSASVSRYRLDAAARRIVADLERARTAARVSGSTRTVEFKPEAGAYAVDGEASLRRAGETYVVELRGDPYRIHGLSAAFGDRAYVTFNAFGLPDRGGQIAVRIGSEQRTIEVNDATGKADIK